MPAKNSRNKEETKIQKEERNKERPQKIKKSIRLKNQDPHQARHTSSWNMFLNLKIPLS